MNDKPDPTWSVEDERARREREGHVDTKTPDVHTDGGEPQGRAELESDKSWSRAGDDNVERETGRKP